MVWMFYTFVTGQHSRAELTDKEEMRANLIPKRNVDAILAAAPFM